jgi:hypothetical protein
MRLRRRFARLAAITTLLGSAAALVATASPAASAASAAPAATQDGWVRCAHLSPNAPIMDIYMYPFGDPSQPTVLRGATYGNVSDYMAVSPGDYTVALRGYGASASSAPILTTSFMVSAGTAFTVAAIGPDPGLRMEVLKDQMTAPMGMARIRVIQASLKEKLVTVSYGPEVLARQLAFGSATSYQTVSPGTQTVRLAAPGESTAASVKLAPDTVHTIVVLDSSAGLKVDTLTDSAGSQTMPMGGADTGLGGTAPRPPADLAPWLVTFVVGMLLTTAGFVALRRTRRRVMARP